MDVPPTSPTQYVTSGEEEHFRHTAAITTSAAAESVTTASGSSVEEVVAVSSKGAYIYDYFNDVDVIKATVTCLSLILVVTAIVFWCVIWCNARFGHPYRCVTFIMDLVFTLIYHLVGLISTLVYLPNTTVCQFLVTLRSYAEISVCTFLFLYVLLCIGVAMRRLESGVKFYTLVAVSLLLPLILVAATTSLRLILHPELSCDLLDDLSSLTWYERAPKCFLLFGTICILSVLFYWLFCFDNTVFKMNRDYLLIRHSSVTVMVMVNYYFFLELFQIVFMSHGPDGNIHSETIANVGFILTILMAAKGSVAAFLLCFFDLEIFNLIHNFPCCPDINSTVVDQSWEKRIRSESKVKFFEDSSSDDNNFPARASGDEDTEKAKDKSKGEKSVLSQMVLKYGSLKEDDGKE